MGKLINQQTMVGASIRSGNYEITPLARRTCFQAPNYRWFLSWQRPKAVVVEIPGGHQELLPIEDVTRRAQLILMGIGLLGSLLIWLVFRKW
jgi:hypothetical protein